MLLLFFKGLNYTIQMHFFLFLPDKLMEKYSTIKTFRKTDEQGNKVKNSQHYS